MQRKMAFSLWLAVGIFAVCQSAWALELGRITVSSPLNQPLRAQVELKGASGEFTNLKARIASPQKYKDEDFIYQNALDSATVTLKSRANGSHYLEIQSLRPMSEPYVDILVEATWPQGQTFRGYTVFLDPPEDSDASTRLLN